MDLNLFNGAITISQLQMFPGMVMYGFFLTPSLCIGQTNIMLAVRLFTDDQI